MILVLITLSQAIRKTCTPSYLVELYTYILYGAFIYIPNVYMWAVKAFADPNMW